MKSGQLQFQKKKKGCEYTVVRGGIYAAMAPQVV